MTVIGYSVHVRKTCMTYYNIVVCPTIRLRSIEDDNDDDDDLPAGMKLHNGVKREILVSFILPYIMCCNMF